MKNTQNQQRDSEGHLGQQLRYEAQQLAARHPAVRSREAELQVARGEEAPLAHAAQPSSISWRRVATLSAAAGLLALVGGGVLTLTVSRNRATDSLAAARTIASQPLPHEVQALPVTDRQPVAAKTTELIAETAVLGIPDALEFVITAPNNEGGYDVVASGIYVPERREIVPLNQLSPAERYAVEQLLDRDQQPRPRQPI